MIQAARVADDDETDSFRRWLEAEPADEVADDLDALRAFAMLLGIVLHGLLSFINIPLWPVQDRYLNDEAYADDESAEIENSLYGQS